MKKENERIPPSTQVTWVEESFPPRHHILTAGTLCCQNTLISDCSHWLQGLNDLHFPAWSIDQTRRGMQTKFVRFLLSCSNIDPSVHTFRYIREKGGIPQIPRETACVKAKAYSSHP